MTESKKTKVDLNSKATKDLLNFISETQEGKYSETKPELIQIKYKRLEIQEYDSSDFVGDENNNEILLFGVSY